MRFGQYTVDVVRLNEDGNPVLDDDGQPDRPFFGRFQFEAEAREPARIMREAYPEDTISRGVGWAQTSPAQRLRVLSALDADTSRTHRGHIADTHGGI